MVSRCLSFNFDFFFIESKSLFFFKTTKGVFILKLSDFFFFKKDPVNFSFLFKNKKNFIDFLSSFYFYYERNFSLFFFKFKIRGLGYRIRFLKSRVFRFFLGTTNYIYFHTPLEVIVKSRRRRMFLISNDLMRLRTIFVNFLFLKKLIPYKLRGVFFPRQIIFLKPGKKKF